MDVLSMRWEEVLFAHWGVEPAMVAEKLPDSIEVDTYDGRAWLGVVSFVMRDIRPRFSPFGLDFAELNLRTYVRADGTPGIYFFSLDAGDGLGVSVARLAYDLPYYRANTQVETDGKVRLRSSRTHDGAPPANFDATYEGVGEDFVAEEGSLEEFLTERYSFFVPLDSGGTLRGDVRHPPWPLREARAEIRTNTVFEANGFEKPEGEPSLLYSPGVDVTATRPRRM